MSNIKLFQDQKIRATFNEEDGKWYFAVVDVVAVLTESNDPKQYVKKLRKRDEQLESNWGTICTPLVIDTAGGPQKMRCANAEGIRRVINT